MRQGAISLQTATQPGEVPALVRFLGKLVLEVLPAALASVIGAFLFAHYQFSQPEAARSATASAAKAVPASAEMMRVVREEHAMIRNLLTAEQSAEKKRIAVADAADARAAADAQATAEWSAGEKRTAAADSADARIAANGEFATADARRILLAHVAEPPQAKRTTPARIANGASDGRSASAPSAELPPVVIASAAQDPALMPPPSRTSFVSRTLAVPGHVMTMTLHAVMAIGGIPSWIGHHVGAADLDSEAPHVGTTS